MNEPTPLTAEQIDELLSAELDGEFDAAARDIGYQPDVARARLDDVDGVEARRHSLAAARDALSEQPPMDELMAARLQVKALNAWADAREQRETERRGDRRRRMYTMAGGLAAAVAIVIGLAVVARNPSDSKNDSASSAVPSEAAPERGASAPAETTYVDFGRADDLVALVGTARGTEAPTSADANANAGAPATSAVLPAAGHEKAARTSDNPAAGDACTAAASQVSGLPVPTLQGPAQLAGEPVHVYVYRAADKEVVVVMTDTCRLVTQQTGPPHKG